MTDATVAAEFEEKQFETALNDELKDVGSLIYAPGQVLEHGLGIDAALVSHDTRLWTLFNSPPNALYPLMRTPAGLRLRPEYWAQLDQALPYFPQTQFNVFLQHKRPHYSSSAGCKEWSFWNGPYFQYNVVDHQQAALEKLAVLAAGQALVAYSCPALHTYEEFWNQVEARTLVDATNFAHATDLSGHGKYTFQSAGKLGLGHSEPESILPLNLRQELGRLREVAPAASTVEALISFDKVVRQAAKEAELGHRHIALTERFGTDVSAVASAVLSIGAFAHLTGSSWLLAVTPDSLKAFR